MYSCAVAKLEINAEEMYCTTGLIPACNVFTWDCKDSLGSFSDDISEVILLKAQPAKIIKTASEFNLGTYSDLLVKLRLHLKRETASVFDNKCRIACIFGSRWS